MLRLFNHAFFVTICLSAILSLASAFDVHAQDGLGQDGSGQNAQKNKAGQTYEAIKGRFENSAALGTNLTAPLTSGTGFTTLDGSKSFNQRISCPASSHYLELFFGLGSGGDLTPVRVKQDINFDGSYDRTYALTVPVSGVCANGVISCTPGSFNDCRSYLWNSGESGSISIQETELSSLAGCYCVNNSCGSNLGFVNRNTILDDLAGGMAGALMREDPRTAISSVQKSDFMIRLAGQDASACAPGLETPQHTYYDDPTKLSGDAFAASTGDRVFGLVKDIPTGDDLSLLTKNCRIERQVTLDEVLSTDVIARVTSAPEYGETACAGDPDCFTFHLGPGEDNVIRGPNSCFYVTKELVWMIDRLDRLTEATLIDASYEDQIAVSINGALVFSTGGFDGVNRPSDCQVDDQFHATINRSIKSSLTVGRNVLKMVIAVKKKGSGVLRGRIRYEPGCDLIESVADTCSTHADDDRCRIDGETVDGVPTFRNGGRTGLTPLAQPRTLYGARCTRSFSKPWFFRDRTYACEMDAADARTFDFNRASHIYSGSTFDQFADQQVGEDGSIIGLTGSYTIDTEFGIGECEQICKTRTTEPDTEVSSAGVVGDFLKNPEANSFNYNQCAAGVCPVGPGETIVSECGCLNEFPQALTLMQSFRLAGQDLICSSGTKQPLL